MVAKKATKKVETKRVTKKAAQKAQTLIAYKGFDKDLACRGFQFKVGETYTHDGVVDLCASGFHACTNPLDVWNYYGPFASRFAVVELSGEFSPKKEDDSKVCAARIHVKAELSLPDFIKSAVKWIAEGVHAASGDSAKLAASGDYAKLAASGDYAQLAASGDYAKLAASGDYAQLAASGDYAQLAASGDSAQLAASGDSAQLAASGDSAKLAASGDYAKLAASGDYAQLAASGDYAQLAASGDSAQLAASGAGSVIASSSYAATAKGIDGTWISLAEFNSDGKCIGFATGCVGKDGIPADKWLKAHKGKLVEAQA